jgi:hypothetical protein
VGILDVQWYQPKWQKNDYYRHNYRINMGDSVTVRYCSPTYGLSATRLTAARATGTGDNLGAEVGNGYLQGVAGIVKANFNPPNTFYPAKYSAMTGLLPEVVPRGNIVEPSTCSWTDATVTTAGPSNGAAAMVASMTALALGAAALAL